MSTRARAAIAALLAGLLLAGVVGISSASALKVKPTTTTAPTTTTLPPAPTLGAPHVVTVEVVAQFGGGTEVTQNVDCPVAEAALSGVVAELVGDSGEVIRNSGQYGGFDAVVRLTNGQPTGYSFNKLVAVGVDRVRFSVTCAPVQ